MAFTGESGQWVLFRVQNQGLQRLFRLGHSGQVYDASYLAIKNVTLGVYDSMLLLIIIYRNFVCI